MGSSDALSSLLSGLGGVEGSAFSRPKTLEDMRSIPKPMGGKHTMNSRGASASSTPLTASSHPSSSRLNGSPTEASTVHQLDQLESIMGQKSMPSGSQHSSLPPQLATSTPADASFDWAFPTSSTPAEHLTSAASIPASDDDPFAEFTTASSATPLRPSMPSSSALPLDDDPLGMFGGTPAPSTVAASHSDDFFGSFSSAEPQQQIPPPPQPFTAFAAASDPPSHVQPPRGAPNELPLGRSKSTAAPPPAETTATAAAAPVAPSHRAFQFLDARRTSPSSPAEDAAAAGTSAAPSHRAFQFLDGDKQQQRHERRPSSGRGGAAAAGYERGIGLDEYDAQYAQQQHAHHHDRLGAAGEGVAEVAHKAAKALQVGTSWFMRAGKQLAKDVTSKLEKTKHHLHIGSGGGGERMHDDGDSQHAEPAVPAFYYDWASQVSRLSPNTRAAALGAMQEEDRLEVQRILDEAELGDAAMAASGDRKDERFVSGAAVGGGRNNFGAVPPPQESESVLCFDDEIPPPPPSYEEVMGPAGGVASSFASAEPPSSSQTRYEEQQQQPQKAPLSPPPQPQPPVEAAADLLGMGVDIDAAAPASQHAHHAASSSSTSHIEDMFTVPTAKPRPPAAPSAARQPSFAPSKPRAAAAAPSSSSPLDSMIDLGGGLPGGVAVDTAGFDALYAEEEAAVAANGESAGEPEIRKVLRQRRIAEKHARMQQQLAEKRAREEAEDAEKAGKVELRDTLKPKIDGWAAGKKDNIRALLSTLHTVLWEGSGWTSPSIADMVDPGKVKRWYMKANLVVHPDKVKQKGGTLEQVTTADMVFDVLKAAWGKFEASK